MPPSRSLLVVVALSIAAPEIGAQGVARAASDGCQDGDLRACAVLGLIYETGAAGIQDARHARMLYELACAQDVAAACVRLELLAGQGVGEAATNGRSRVGYVADAEDGAPIAEARIDVPDLGVRVVSDEAGRVDLGPLPKGLFPIVARHLEYEATVGELPVPWDTDFLMLLERATPVERSVEADRTETPDRAPDAALDDRSAAVDRATTAEPTPRAASLPAGDIFGEVTVAGSEVGLADVSVTVRGTDPVRTVTNRDGRFSLTGVVPGQVEMEFERVGYHTRTSSVEVPPGRTVEVYAVMSTEAVLLPAVEVTVGSAYLDRTGFYRRARSARGDQFTRRDIVRIDPGAVSDLMWRARGVRVMQGRNGMAVLSRRPSSLSGGQCRLRPYLDGAPMWDWDLDALRPDDLQGLEVYQGSATPVEYRQVSDPDGFPACGVVLVWTRRNN